MKSLTKQTVRIYWQHTWKYPGLVLVVILGTITAIGIELYRAFIFRDMFNALSKGVEFEKLAVQLLVFWTLISFVRVTAWRAVNYSHAKLRSYVMADLIRSCYEYIHNHSYRFFSENFVGSLVTKVKRFENSFLSLARLVIYDIGRTILTCVGIITILLFYKPLFGLIALVWSLLYLVANIVFLNSRLKKYIRRSEIDSEVTGVLADTITNNLNIKIFNGENSERDRFWQVTDKHKKIRKGLWYSNIHFNVFQTFAMIGLEFALFFVGIHFWRLGQFTMGDFILLQIYMLRMFDLLWNLGEDLVTFYEALSDSEEMTAIFTTKHEVVDKSDAKRLNLKKGEIEFKKVNFAYLENSGILNNFSLKVSPGEKVAFVGPSGGGKTTVVKLLFRLFDIQGGRIEIDGQDISKVTQSSLRSVMSLVPQDPIMFHRSLMENIAYARPNATEAEVIKAAKLAHCHEFISTFEHGYNTFVGERGVKLSGGERQRVAIARAILKDSPILVLDEATSSLDSESERLIQDALATLMKNKTVLVIAHRLSTIMQMDRIIVLEKGKIIESGSHSDLLKLNEGTYQKLWHIQAGNFTSV